MVQLRYSPFISKVQIEEELGEKGGGLEIGN
jgi:hypothetical protein